MAIPKKVVSRIKSNFKKYQKILSDAKSRDVSESDTVVIIMEILSEVLGYNKFSEITTEYAIRNTYVDLAVKVSEDIRFLIEAKAIGVNLNDAHVKQAIDYGANHGIEWVILTNGIVWRVYKIHFKQPIEKTLISEIDILSDSTKNESVVECFGILSKEGFSKNSISAYFQQQQATSRFSLAALLLSEPVLTCLKREVKKVAPKLKVDNQELKSALKEEVIKRELMESDEAKSAEKFIKKNQKPIAKKKMVKNPIAVPENN